MIRAFVDYSLRNKLLVLVVGALLLLWGAISFKNLPVEAYPDVAGLSSLSLIFDDESANDWNRQKVLERLSGVTLPNNLQPTIGPDYSPVGQLYWYTLKSTNPRYDLMELKSLEDWVIEKQLKSVPDVIMSRALVELLASIRLKLIRIRWSPMDWVFPKPSRPLTITM